MKPIQLPAAITSISTKADNSLSLRINTQELSSEAKVELMNYLNVFGWICIVPNKLKEEEIPANDAEREEKKTLSERLRSVQFLYHRQQSNKGKITEDFDSWRRKAMESLIDQYKEKLDA